ncbi:YceI family protein [Streptomyces sp. SID3343]|uniref:YceI family protein n=1 Tax=Streptomyces sp. SID3343 TaxID=2690260 RepID=UPI0013719231|nr:YceI family protein [Streptomyces sp. SID3343]MYW00563.1 polyisoprenoid-binding protein [Streptomyces sp. SID3343]
MTTTTALGDLTGDYVLDTTHTRITFVARHTMATRVRGRFDTLEGSAHMDGHDPSKSGARLTIRAASIETRNPQRDRLLRARFLDSDHHPTITFTTTGVEQVGETDFEVAGDLTIRGLTKPVTTNFELIGAEHDPHGNFRARFKGRVVINRMDWKVNWNAATRATIGDKVTLEFDVSAIRQS